MTMSRIIVFNACRGSEVAELMFADYGKKNNSVDETVFNSMTEEEKQLINR